MGWAEVADVRTLVYTAEADSQVEKSLDSAKKDIEAITGSIIGIVPDTLFNAHKYLSAITLMNFMITSGELAYMNKMGPDQTYNKPEDMIARYQKKFEQSMAQYGYSTNAASLYAVIKLEEV